MRDLLLALRALRATPIVTAVAVLSLALGIGANSAIFSLVNSLLLRPLPVAAPERLVTVASDFAISRGFKAGAGWNYGMWERMRPSIRLFDGGFAWSVQRLDLGRGVEAEPVNGVYASGEFFTTLGVRPLRGRVFTPADDVPGAGPVAVISHGLWTRRLGAAPQAVGATLAIDGIPFTIVGITPPEFLGLEVGQAYDVALPLNAEPLIRGRNTSLQQAHNYFLLVMLRLKPGQSLRAATETIRGLQAEIVPPGAPAFAKEPFVLAPAAEGTSSPNAGGGALRQRFQRPLLTLLALVALVLLIACINIANLQLARAMARRHDIAVRVALGASPWRLARLLLIDSLVLAGAGAAAGLVFAAWASRLLVAQLSTSVSEVVLDLGSDWRVVAFTATLTMATALLFGVAPAFRATRVSPLEALKTDGRRSPDTGRSRLSSSLVVAQIALSLVLVVIAGLLLGTFERLVAVPLGFDRDRVLVATVDTVRARIDGAERLPFVDRLVHAVANVPGVERAAGSLWTPMSGGGALLGVDVPGAPAGERGVVANFVTPGWFGTYGTPLREGRDIDPRDSATASPVLMVNDAFVRRFFPGGHALGAAVTLPGTGQAATPSRTIVGVVADAVFRSGRMIPGVPSTALRDGVPPMIYLPLAQSAGMGPYGSTTIRVSVRSAGGAPALLSRSVAVALATVQPDLTVTFRPLSDYANQALAEDRLVAMLSGFFGGLASLLAGLGLYGLTAYAVVRRRTEIGIRMALGAERRDVVGLVLRKTLVLTAVGMALGLAGAAAVTRYLEGMLFGLSALDPVTFAGGAAAFAAVSTVAALIPARRASTVEPLIALRPQ